MPDSIIQAARKPVLGPFAASRPRAALVGFLVLAPWLAAGTAADPAGGRKAWIPVGRLDPSRVREPSGVVKSRRYPGVFWTHGDSGNSATLFAFKESGELLAEVPLAEAANSDWEDVAIDQAGNLCVGDIGNHKEFFPLRYVYVVPEPDLPAKAGPHARPVQPVRWSRRIVYKYPGPRFNAESLFVLGGAIHVISIGLREGPPTVYRLEPVSERECVLKRVQQLPLYQARGADVSADGEQLAICTPTFLWVIGIDEQGRILTDRKPMRVTFPVSQMESCCFDGGDVVLVNEAGYIYRVTAADLRANRAFTRPKSRRERRPGSAARQGSNASDEQGRGPSFMTGERAYPASTYRR